MNLTFCTLAIIFIISSIYLCFMKRDNKIFMRFNRLLNKQQQKIYQTIIRERLTIYIIGIILGIILGVLYLYNKSKIMKHICIFICIIYITKLVVYYIAPKSPLMLYSLTSQVQVKAWADIYTEMKKRWVTSLFVGGIGYILLSVAMKD
jgi:hypothetical protein